MEEVDRYYQGNITLEGAESYIASGMMTAVRAFVANGYYLRRIRDEKLYKESGYKNFKEYLEDRYKKDEGWASKCIKVNQQLSEGGNSPILDSRYRDYSDKYKLVELASMTEEQRSQVSPDMSVKALREFRKGDAENLVTSQENKVEENELEVMDAVQEVATLETPEPEPQPRAWNIYATPCIHRNGFSCTVPDDKKVIPGDGSNCNESCCWECTRQGECKLECNCSASRPEEPEPVPSEPDPVIDAEYEEVPEPAKELKPERPYSLEEVAKEIERTEAIFLGAPDKDKQSVPYRRNVMRLDAMRLLYDSMKGE